MQIHQELCVTESPWYLGIELHNLARDVYMYRLGCIGIYGLELDVATT